MPNFFTPDYGWRDRITPRQRERATDIIRNCRCKGDDAKFASKYGLARNTVRNIRLGQGWAELRTELELEESNV